ncbi:Abscisic acid G-protein coupled receptor [Nitzschia inconspicua]|uniref:Abscisic acid G-protein coupled receptor n=1 Tax=Nitzschia inconspicua TaxID=303405 RepID=A0A9K3PV35_9STRA|nr:Abscisic acid G-protein coupled receptor [Nitzschia inconspicua]
MDVFLLGTSISLSAYLPRFLFDSKMEQATLFLSMGLSLALFSLTLLEAMPKSTLMLLNSESSLRNSYWLLLSALSIHILVVLPSLAGASVAESFGDFFLPINRDRDDCKYPLLNWRKLPWWIRFLVGLIQIVFRGIHRTICLFGGKWGSSSGTSSDLVMTIHDEKELHLSTTSSSDTFADGSLVTPSPSRRASSIVSLTSPLNSNNIRRLQERRNVLLTMGCLTGIVTILIALSTIGPMIVQPPAERETTTLSRIISWLCAVGLLLSSLLNGFGSVSLPFTYLSGIFLKPVRQETVTKMSSELRSMQEALAKKRMTVKELSVEIASPTSNSTTTTASRSSGVSINGGRSSMLAFGSLGFGKNNTSHTFSDIKEDIKNRRQILQTEIEFLEDLIRETSLDIEEMKHSQSMAVAARTNTGRLKSWIGIVFSMILLLRLLNAGFSIWTSSTTWNVNTLQKMSRNDIVTTALLWLTGRDYISQKRYTMLSQMVSLGLTAVLSFSQVRMFLRTVAVVNRRLSSFWKKCWCGAAGASGSGGKVDSRDFSVSFHSQVISGFLGCYSVACIVLIKMMLPTKFSDSFSAALGETDIFTIHSSMVNVVFFFSAVISTSILGMLLGIQRQNNLRHAAATADKVYYGPDV